MRERIGIVSVMCMLAVGLVAAGLLAQERPSRRAAREPAPAAEPPPQAPATPQPPRPPEPPRPAEPPKPISLKIDPDQRTRLQVDVFELTCPGPNLVKLDLDQMVAENASAEQIVARLAPLGEARLVTRLVTQFDLTRRTSITSGKRLPCVQNVSVSKEGRVTPSVTYEQVGVSLEVSGQWLPDGDWGQLTCRIESSDVGYNSLPGADEDGPKFPAFVQLKINQDLLVKSGQPVMLMTNDQPMPGDEKAHTTVTIVRLKATRLEQNQ